MGVCPAFDLTEGATHVAMPPTRTRFAFTLPEGATHVAMPPTRARFAFTLTEVLLAVVIVGVLAALVLPAVVTHFQEKGFAQAYVRETKTIQSAIEGLAVNENKASFFETMMYKDAEPENYSDNAEYFLKKYLRVSKICGDNNGDCFGKTYYNYEDNDKKIFTPEFKGSCAVLKNGASICLTPQIGASPIVGLIDINGPKGPNVLSKDLRTFSIAAETRLGKNSGTEAVLEFKFDPIVTDEGDEDPCAGETCGCGDLPPCDPCEGKTCGCGSLPPCETPCSPNPNLWDLSCCEKNSGSINSYTHHCCTFTAVKNAVPACNPTITHKYKLSCRLIPYYPYMYDTVVNNWAECDFWVEGLPGEGIPVAKEAEFVQGFVKYDYKRLEQGCHYPLSFDGWSNTFPISNGIYTSPGFGYHYRLMGPPPACRSELTSLDCEIRINGKTAAKDSIDYLINDQYCQVEYSIDPRKILEYFPY